VKLLIRTQIILFSRFAGVLEEYKYAGYPLLMEALTVPDGAPVTQDLLRLLNYGAQLVYLTCLCCMLNAQELTRVNGVETLADLFHRCMTTITKQTDATELTVQVSTHVLHTFTGLSAFDRARDRMAAMPSLIFDMCRSLELQQAAKAVHYSLESIGRLANSTGLQDMLINSGLLWYIVPLLLSYDSSLAETEEAVANAKQTAESTESNPDQTEDERREVIAKESISTEDSKNAQKDANRSAMLGARAVSRVGGFLFEPLHTPKNAIVQQTMEQILTPSVSPMLRRKNPGDLLKLLNENCETPLVIWNGGMRKELRAFAEKQLKILHDGSATFDPYAGCTYEFESLCGELKVGKPGVYVRIFIEQGNKFKIEEPDRFCTDILKYMSEEKPFSCRSKSLESAVGDVSLQVDGEDSASIADSKTAPPPDLRGRGIGVMADGVEASRARIAMCLQSLTLLLKQYDVFDQVIGSPHGVELLFSYLEEDYLDEAGSGRMLHTKSEDVALIRKRALDVILLLAPNQKCANQIITTGLLGTLLHLLRRGIKTAYEAVLAILSTLCSTSSAVGEMLKLGGIVDMIAFYQQKESVSGSLPTRAGAAKVLCQMMGDGLHGPKTMVILKRLMPEGLVHDIREDPDTAVATFDKIHETPELIWTENTRETLRDEMKTIFRRLAGQSAPGSAMPTWRLPDDYVLSYPELDREIKVGGIYLRLYLKDPKYNLRSPRQFLEELLRVFIAKASSIVRDTLQRIEDGAANAGKAASGDFQTLGDGRTETRQIIKFETEDKILSPVCSSIVCLLRVRVVLVDHASQLGYGVKMMEVLEKVCKVAPQGVVAASALRIIHQFAESKEMVKSIARMPVMSTLVKCVTPVNESTTFTLECMKRILQQNTSTAPPASSLSDGTMASAGNASLAFQNSDSLDSRLVGEALKEEVGLISFLASILDGSADGIDKLGDGHDAARAHAVDILHVLEKDGSWGQLACSQTSKHTCWNDFRHQKHDLFLNRKTQKDADLMLTYGPGYENTTKGRMLKDGSADIVTRAEANSNADSDIPPPAHMID
jgi:DnaJ family protein C protein 13